MWDSRAVISRLLDILTIFARNNLKSKILKELDRHSSVLNQIGKNRGVNHNKLESILEELDSISRKLYGTSRKIGIRLREDELFQTIAQHSSIPGRACAVDLPEYHFWLEHSEQ